MRYYIIAGEASGDLHGSNLMKEIRKRDPHALFRCWGGDLMQQQGGELVKHYRDLAFMGFWEVIVNLRTILRNLKKCREDIKQWQPDAVILIDYPGFNLRMAGFAKANGLKVFYYISPQVWAWKQSRVHRIKRTVDRMFVILPFEKEFYQRFGYEVDFVGHPLLDALPPASPGPAGQKPLVLLLPGSRQQEICRILPVMLAIPPHFPEYEFAIACAPSVPVAFYKQLMKGTSVQLIPGKTYELLSKAHTALVTSGTATLETALFGVPQVVCYQGSRLSFFIARQLVKVKFISLVNLIMDSEIVKELIQDNFNRDELLKETSSLLTDEAKRNRIKTAYNELRMRLGGAGASAKTAGLIREALTGRK